MLNVGWLAPDCIYRTGIVDDRVIDVSTGGAGGAQTARSETAGKRGAGVGREQTAVADVDLVAARNGKALSRRHFRAE